MGFPLSLTIAASIGGKPPGATRSREPLGTRDSAYERRRYEGILAASGSREVQHQLTCSSRVADFRVLHEVGGAGWLVCGVGLDGGRVELAAQERLHKREDQTGVPVHAMIFARDHLEATIL